MDSDPQEQLRTALLISHPAFRDWDLEPSAAFALMLLTRMRSHAAVWRLALVREQVVLKEDMTDVIQAWAASLSASVTEAYNDYFQCVPLFTCLLKKIRYPDAVQLDIDLTHAFALVGDIPGAGWPTNESARPRFDGTEFRQCNDAHVRNRLQTSGTPQHSSVLLAEVLREHEAGRIRGPFELPNKWGCSAAVPPAGLQLLPAPASDECFAAFAFPIVQVGSDGDLKNTSRRRLEAEFP